MTRCGVCGRPCAPLADYDAPTCVHCDSDMEAVLVRASLTVDLPAKQMTGQPIVTYCGVTLRELDARVERIRGDFAARRVVA